MGWFLVIYLDSGMTYQTHVGALHMCGLKSHQFYYENHMPDGMRKGNWACVHGVTGQKVTGKQFMSHEKYSNPFNGKN